MITFEPAINLWWPDYEADPIPTHNKAFKRAPDCLKALKYVTGLRTCVQAGGHVGIWPRLLKEHFARVISFEPDVACCAALRKNAPEVEAHNAALGALPGTAHLRLHWRTGSAKITSDGTGDLVVVETIDQLDLQDCDLIVLDTEGSELRAIMGAEKTIERCHPVIYIEDHAGDRQSDLHAHIKALGYEFRERIHNDSIWKAEQN